VIIGLFPELLGIGGVQEAGRQSARALHEIARRHGWQAQMFSLNDAPGDHQLPFCELPVHFYGFGHRKTSFVLSITRLALSLPRRSPKFVLAAHPNLALPACGMKIFSPSIQTIVMTHGVEVWNRLAPLRRVALSYSDIVLAPSHDTAKRLTTVQELSIEKIRRLAWPLSPNFLRLADAPTSLTLPEAFPRGSVIMTVGRWAKSERYKGVDDLIDATSDLRRTLGDLHLVVVGAGDDLPRLQKLVSDRGIATFVHFLGHLTSEELAACYAKSDVFAMPSTGEGFGLVFLEAMAFAKPIVASTCGGTMDLVENDVNGLLVQPHDAKGLAVALESLLRNEPLRTRLGRHGAQIVRQKYQYEGFEAGLGRIVDELALLQAPC
jgi:phosphatidylinositol alpha-1,6-mannosyltransferase